MINNIRIFLSLYPIFLLTIPGAFIIHMNNYYHRLMNWGPVIRDLSICIIVPIIIYIIFRRNDKYRRKTGVLLFWFLVLFYFFHVLHDGLKKIPFLSFLSSYSAILSILAIAGFIFVRYVIKTKHSFDRTYYIGNLVFLLLYFGGMGELIYLNATTKVTHNDQADPQKKLTQQFVPCDTCSKPDIYYIVLDGYTNSKTLRSEFNYENAWVTNFLQDKKFHIVEKSKSNYYFTQVSLASILNLDYLKRLNTDKLFQTKEFFQANYTISENELCGILKMQGYEINNFSIFDIKGHPSRVRPFLEDLPHRSVIGQTFFHKLNRDIGYHLNSIFRQKRLQNKVDEANNDIERMRETLRGVVRTAKFSSDPPRFTYGHFLVPHETYYFDSTGRKNDIAAVISRGYKRSDYIDQVAYTNHFIIAPIVQTIFDNAKRPFIIIFQGDHGYRNYPPEKLDLEFENFYAVYYPDQDYRRFGETQSAVNTFRIVLDQYLGQQLPMLKDSSIYLKKRVMIQP